VPVLQALIRVKCLTYVYEIEQANIKADQMEAIDPVYKSKLVANSSTYVLVY
jgi:hypothetical protein